MPGLNHKGPDGEGPKTGRGLGNCNPKSDTVNETEELNPRRLGRMGGRGKGRGMGNNRSNRPRRGRNL